MKKPQHRARLVALASDTLLFRSPSELAGAHRASRSRVAAPTLSGRARDPWRAAPAERLHTLRQVLWLAAGIYDADVGAMVGRYPRVVCGDLSVSASLKLSALANGLPGIDLKRLLEATPQLLSLEPETTVIARAHALARLLPRRDVLRMCELHPPLLTCCVQRTVAPALCALRAALRAAGAPDATAETVAEAAPRLLTSAPATVAARLSLLERLAPGTVAHLATKPHALARLLCASERALMRIAFVRAMAPSSAQTLGPSRVVGLSSALFAQRFPGFDAWLAREQRRDTFA